MLLGFVRHHATLTFKFGPFIMGRKVESISSIAAG